MDDTGLTIREVADRLRVSPEFVRRWIKAGILPAHRVGPIGKYRIKADDLHHVERDR